VKPVKRHKQFEKHFNQRIAKSPKLIRQFEKRLELFMGGYRNEPLNDHPLTGALAGKRAFSINGGFRVICLEFPDVILFIDIGTHNQVY